MRIGLIYLIVDEDIEKIISDLSFNYKLKKRLIDLSDSFWPSSLNYDEEVHQYILTIPDDELEKLIKFYVLAGKHVPDLSRGSVSGAIPLLQIYKERNEAKYDKFLEWVFEHKNNPYVPFGSFIGDHIKSKDEYLEFQSFKRDLKEANRIMEYERYKEATIRKAAVARENIKKAIARNDLKAIEALQKTIDKENEFR